MVRLDERELALWYRHALAEFAEKRLLAMDAARSAWMSGEGYREVAAELQHEIDTLRSNKSYHESVTESWAQLKALGGG